MKKTASLLILLLIPFLALSQDSMQDVIYLKNGTIYRGTIIEQVPNESFKLQTRDGNTYVVALADVLRLAKEKPLVQQPEPAGSFRQSGFANFTELGFLAGVGSVKSYVPEGTSNPNDLLAFSLYTSNGWQIGPHVYTGLGVGVEKWSYDYRLPIYIDTRYFILKKTLSPLLYTNMGYAFGWNEGTDGADWAGIFMGAGAGAIYRFSRTASLSISVGYKMQQVKLEWIYFTGYPQNEYLTREERSFANFILVKAGVGF